MILAELREATRAAHTQLEKRLALFERVRDRESLTAHLKSMASCYLPLENKVFAHPDWAKHDADVRALRRGDLLGKDLESLGVALSDVTAMPDAALPRFATFAEALGGFYVLEGSKLGGQVVARHFKKTLSVPGPSLRFYEGAAEGTGPSWKATCAFLDDYFKVHGDAPARAEVVAAAVDTFRAMEKGLCDDAGN